MRRILGGLLDRPPGWPMLAAALVVGLAWLWFSRIGGNAVFVVIWVWPAVLLSGYWLMRVVVFGLRQERWSRRILWAPAVGVATVILLVTAAVPRAQWHVMEPTLTAYAKDVATGADPAAFMQRSVWSARIESAWRAPDGIYFTFEGDSFVDTVGYAYLPDGPSKRATPGISYPRHLGGQWYRFRQRM